MADHLRRRLASPDTVLLLVEESEARHEVTGHQVCVLTGATGPVRKLSRMACEFLTPSSHGPHARKHTQHSHM